MPEINDNRTDEQKTTHVHFVIATDKFMSGWGGAEGGASYAAWACDSVEDMMRVKSWVESRHEMRRVRTTYSPQSSPYRPGCGCSHLSIYVVTEDHRALS